MGTAQSKCRNGIALLVILNMVEINLAVRHKVNKTVPINIREIFLDICCCRRKIYTNCSRYIIPSSLYVRSSGISIAANC